MTKTIFALLLGIVIGGSSFVFAQIGNKEKPMDKIEYYGRLGENGIYYTEIKGVPCIHRKENYAAAISCDWNKKQ